MKRLTVGIVGGGETSAIGPTHVAALRMDGRWRLGPSMFAREEAENRTSHAAYGLEWTGHCDDLDRYLDRHGAGLDLVVVITPSDMHFDQCMTLIRRGVPFLTEKPVCCAQAESTALRAALAGHPAQFARFVHNYSAYPLFREMVLRCEGGAVGRVLHARIEMPSDGYARERIIGKPQGWRQKDPEVPMLMLDLGTHMHHLLRMLVGPSAARVMARNLVMTNSMGVIDHTEIWEDRADGIRASHWMSKSHLGHKNGLAVEIYGSDGALAWRQMDPDHLIQSDLNSNRTIVNRGAITAEAGRQDRFKPGHPTGFVEAFGNFYSDLADDLAAHRAGTAGPRWIRPLSEALDGIDFMGAATRAGTTGEWMDT